MPDPSGSDFIITEADVEGTLGARFDAVAALAPDSPALSITGRSVTYRGLAGGANAIARQLVTKLGDSWAPVAILIHDPIARVAAMLGALKANKAFTVLDEAQPPARLDYLLTDLGATAILHDEACGGLAESLEHPDRIARVNVDGLQPTDEECGAIAGLGPDTIAMIIYTSGSTGASKGVMRDHRMMLNRARVSQSMGEAQPSDRKAMIASSAFSAALNGIFTSLMCGGCECLASFEDIGITHLGGWLAEQRVSILSLNVALARHWCDALNPAIQLPDLRGIQIFGSAALKRDALALRERVIGGWRLTTTYSSTETTVSTVNAVAESAALADGPLPLGRPCADRELLVLDEQRRPAGPGVYGEIAVRSKYIARGYWRMPELTSRKFLQDPGHPPLRTFLTGDFGRITQDGQLEIIGRTDAMVKVRGFRVDTSEVERALLSVPNVRDGAIVARATADGDARLAAFAAPASGAQLTRREVRAALEGVLPRFMVPSRIIVLPDLPLLANGKLDRRALPDPDTLADEDGADAQPADALETLVHQAWCKVLHRQQIGMHEPFGDAGGDSFAAALLEMELAAALGHPVPVEGLFQAPTIAQQAEMIRNRPPGAERPSAVRVWPMDGGDGGLGQAPVFCLPANNGSLTEFVPLARALDQPTHSLALPSLESVRGIEFMDAIVDLFAGQMLAVQPEGPYRVMASCNMSKFALALCDRLARAGHEVQWAVIVDAPVGRRRDRDMAFKPSRWAAWLAQGARSLVAEARLEGSLHAARLVAASAHDVIRRVTHPLAQRMTTRQMELHERLVGLGDTFVPRKFAFRVIYVKGAWSQFGRYYDGTSRMMGWDPYLPNAELIIVPASHSSMFRPPFVRAFARGLADVLNQSPQAAA